ncbi:hypothetical protein [Alistipes timonensis]
MATRCLIGTMCEDRIRAIYCHWDGYPEHVGAILCKHYATAERAEALISLGCISTLGPKIAPETEFAEPEIELHGPGLVRHSFATPQKDVTVAYHRDRGDSLEIYNFYSERGFNHSVRIPVPYHYLFKDGQWYVDGCPLSEN